MQRSVLHREVNRSDAHHKYIREPEPDYIEESDNYVSHYHSSPDLPDEAMTRRGTEVDYVNVREYSMSSATNHAHVNSLVKPWNVESKERQAVHKELLMNWKMGKELLKQPELNKVLRERREKERQREWDEQKSSNHRTGLQVKLEERANRIKEDEEKRMKLIMEETETPELTRVYRKITLKSSRKNEK